MNDSALRNNLTLNPSAEEFNGITHTFVDDKEVISADVSVPLRQQLFPQNYAVNSTIGGESHSHKQSYSSHQTSNYNQIPQEHNPVGTPVDLKFGLPRRGSDLAAYGTNQSIPKKYL